MTDHSKDPDAIARQTELNRTRNPAATRDGSTVQANPVHMNPRPDHPGPVNPVTPAYSGSRGSPDDLEEPDNILGPQPGANANYDPASDRQTGTEASPPQDRPRDAQSAVDPENRGVPDDAPPAGGQAYHPQGAHDQQDAEILRQVHDRLNAHPLIDPSEFDVKVDKGRVTLTGTVSHPETVHNAAVCLAPIAGITALYNELRTSPYDRKSASEQETSDPGKSGL